MNKLVIPAILVSITLVAGIFAFMPVEKASTVHTTIQANNEATARSVSFMSLSGVTIYDDPSGGIVLYDGAGTTGKTADIEINGNLTVIGGDLLIDIVCDGVKQTFNTATGVPHHIDCPGVDLVILNETSSTGDVTGEDGNWISITIVEAQP